MKMKMKTESRAAHTAGVFIPRLIAARPEHTLVRHQGDAHLLKVRPLMVFFSVLSFSGMARLRTCSQLEQRVRMRVCICDLAALTWKTR